MAQTELKRQIGLFDAVMLISGDMIGTGIFISTGVIAAQVLSPGGVLLVWILAGLLALTGALSCAELSASLPYAGGDYNYIREAYGKLIRVEFLKKLREEEKYSDLPTLTAAIGRDAEQARAWFARPDDIATSATGRI